MDIIFLRDGVEHIEERVAQRGGAEQTDRTCLTGEANMKISPGRMTIVAMAVVLTLTGCGKNPKGSSEDGRIQTLTLRIFHETTTIYLKAYPEGRLKYWVEPEGSEAESGPGTERLKDKVDQAFVLGERILSEVEPGKYHAERSIDPECELEISRGGQAYRYHISETDNQWRRCPEALLTAVKRLSGSVAW